MFRGAVRGDLPQILKIYAHARAVMKASGNPTQWGDNFPPQELLEEDIDSNRLFLYVVNGQIEAVFAFILGADPTYAAIEDGQWLDDTLPYGTVHRLASAGKHKGVASAVLDWSMEHCQSLRADTHADNKIMQHLLEKNGFTRCGIIHVADGSPRFAYQKLAPTQPLEAEKSKPLWSCCTGFYPCATAPFIFPEKQTCSWYKYRSTEKPHGHRPECKFVNEKCLKTLSFLCRMCYNNTRPCVRDRKLCAIGVQ